MLHTEPFVYLFTHLSLFLDWKTLFERASLYLVVRQPQRPGEQQHQQAVPGLSVALRGQAVKVG